MFPNPDSDKEGIKGSISRASSFTKNAFRVEFKPPSNVIKRAEIYSLFEMLISGLFDSADKYYIDNSTSQFIFVENYSYIERIVNALLCEWVRKYFVNCAGMTKKDIEDAAHAMKATIEAIVAEENVPKDVNWNNWIEHANKLRLTLNSTITKDTRTHHNIPIKNPTSIT